MSNLTPELAAKVLEADKRNIVKKVGDGGVLSSPERDLIERHADADLLKERHQALLRRWCQGQTLTPDQAKEIDHLLPAAPHLLKHITRASYQQKLSVYAEQIGCKDRALERWIEAGRKCDPPDLPPFDEPSQLIAWWSRVMTQRVPPRLLKFAATPVEAKPATNGTKPTSSSPPPPQQQQQSQPRQQPLELPEGSGFAAALDRCRQNERIASARMGEALEQCDLGRIEMTQRAWEKAFESLRKAEKDAEGVLLASGEMVRWSEVERDLAETLQSLNQSLRSLFVRVATKVPVPSDLYQPLNRAMQEELDRLFAQCGRADYAPSFELEAA